MPKICYAPHTFSEERLKLIEKCDEICRSYAAQGYDLTLRQTFYQLVSRAIIPNTQRDYKNLGDLLGEARMAGLINWDHIVDRTRSLMGNRHWNKPSDLINEASQDYAINKWEDQDNYLECWVEKSALEGVIGRICGQMDVPFFSCRGYTSISEMWIAGQRLIERLHKGKKVHIIHLGDHDPSGIDMSRDIKERLDTFISAHMPGETVHVLRVALNMAQIDRLHPPPNPTKLSDSRATDYIAKYGEECWELDALDPVELNAIVERAVKMYRDEKKWEAAVKKEKRGRKTLEAIYADFPNVVRFLRGEVV